MCSAVLRRSAALRYASRHSARLPVRLGKEKEILEQVWQLSSPKRAFSNRYSEDSAHISPRIPGYHGHDIANMNVYLAFSCTVEWDRNSRRHATFFCCPDNLRIGVSMPVCYRSWNSLLSADTWSHKSPNMNTSSVAIEKNSVELPTFWKFVVTIS